MILEEIDKSLDTLKAKIQELCSDMEFVYIQEFDINISNEEINKLKSDHKYKGLYFFEIKADSSIPYEEWIKNFVEDWDNDLKTLKHVPTSKIKRISKHDKIRDWMPLYIGKRIDVGNRIERHINLSFESTTFGIKFKVRQKFKNARFRLSVLRLEIENYDMIAPVIENYFREKFNPIVGKQ